MLLRHGVVVQRRVASRVSSSFTATTTSYSTSSSSSVQICGVSSQSPFRIQTEKQSTSASAIPATTTSTTTTTRTTTTSRIFSSNSSNSTARPEVQVGPMKPSFPSQSSDKKHNHETTSTTSSSASTIAPATDSSTTAATSEGTATTTTTPGMMKTLDPLEQFRQMRLEAMRVSQQQQQQQQEQQSAKPATTTSGENEPAALLQRQRQTLAAATTNSVRPSRSALQPLNDVMKDLSRQRQQQQQAAAAAQELVQEDTTTKTRPARDGSERRRPMTNHTTATARSNTNNTNDGQHNQQRQQQQQYRNNNNNNYRFRQQNNNDNNNHTYRQNNHGNNNNNSTSYESNRYNPGSRSSGGKQISNHRHNNNSSNNRPDSKNSSFFGRTATTASDTTNVSSSSRLADLMEQLKRNNRFSKPSSHNDNNSDDRRNDGDHHHRRGGGGDNNSIGRHDRRPSWQQQQRSDPRSSSSSYQDRYQQQQQSPRPMERDRVDFLSGGNNVRNGTAAGRRPKASQAMKQQQQQPRVVTLPAAPLTLTEASTLFRIRVDDIQGKLRAMGAMEEEEKKEQKIRRDKENGGSKSESAVVSSGSTPKIQQQKEFRLDVDLMELVAMEFGIETTRSEEEVVLNSEQLLMQQRKTVDASMDDVAKYPPRPPVVTIMGHVDHGKTTLMDALRRQSLQQQSKAKASKKAKSKKGKASATASDNVAGTEAGGITQIISAFEVAFEGQDNKITFLDTPGHAAFTAMRHSGTHAADVIVLVVAADDGISEQTIEIINLYKSIVKGSSDSGISMVVALNKIDKPGIDVDEAKRRIENQLLEHDIIAEGMNATDSEYGQPVQVIPTSGLTGLGLDDLMEGLLLQSEIMDLRADDNADAEGIIMDARLEKGLGVVADCIIRWGNIKKGDIIISGDQMARVRMIKDVNDKVLKQGLPSQPVRIVGFKDLPKAGDPLMVVESEERAEEMLEQRLTVGDDENDRPEGHSSDVELHIHGQRRVDTWRVRKVQAKANLEEEDGNIRIPIIVKADADGSLSAVRESLVNLGVKSKHSVLVDPISEGIGEVTPSDIQMAKESEATIFAFGLKRIDPSILNLAESEGVQICSSDIIYSLLDTAQESLGSYLPPLPKEHVHGRAVVKAIFTIDTEDGKEKIAGMNVLDGHVYKATVPSPDVPDDGSPSPQLKCHYRVFRDGKLISPEGQSVTASSLRRFKELVESVRRGDDCGLGLHGFDGFEEGDEIECYSIEMKKGKL